MVSGCEDPKVEIGLGLRVRDFRVAVERLASVSHFYRFSGLHLVSFWQILSDAPVSFGLFGLALEFQVPFDCFVPVCEAVLVVEVSSNVLLFNPKP